MRIEDWGLIHYEEATRRQLEAVDEVHNGGPERIIVCTHPPVVTLGRGTKDEDLTGWTGETYATTRGGRATYHGPNQVIIYPIVDLRLAREGLRERDVHAYLRAIEDSCVSVLKKIGLPNAEARTTKSGEISLTGVWIGAKKIASIGIAVRRWITYHGVAINVLHDPAAFKGIQPCGFSSNIMTSIEEELSETINYSLVREEFVGEFARKLALSSVT